MQTQAQLFSNEPAFVNQRACVYKKFVSQSLLHQGQKQRNISCVMPHSALSIILIHIVKILDSPVTPFLLFILIINTLIILARHLQYITVKLRQHEKRICFNYYLEYRLTISCSLIFTRECFLNQREQHIVDCRNVYALCSRT